MLRKSIFIILIFFSSVAYSQQQEIKIPKIPKIPVYGTPRYHTPLYYVPHYIVINPTRTYRLNFLNNQSLSPLQQPQIIYPNNGLIIKKEYPTPIIQKTFGDTSILYPTK